MSWWDKYLAPGDARAQQRALQLSTPDTDKAPEDSQQAPIPSRIDPVHRARRQNALLFGGLAFTVLSVVVTRRALRRKQLATYPHLVIKTANERKLHVPHFTQSNIAAKAEGGVDAAEALFLATLGVGSVFMAVTGALMKYFDVADVEDLRDVVRKSAGYDVYAGDSEADKEIEKWAAEVLSNKDGTGNFRDSIVLKMAELAELEKNNKEKAETEAKTTASKST